MKNCPSCGRYVGPYGTCPHCAARLSGRLSIRTIQTVAITAATLGLALLWLAATRAPIPTIQVQQAGATANMAYVRVDGWVTRNPTYYPDSGYLAFTMGDGTGEMRVSAYRHETEALRAAGRVPALGDRVVVAGTLRVREDGAALTVNVADHVQVLRPEAVERTIGSITERDRLLRVRIRGHVWAVRQPTTGLTIITLRDPTGAIDVAVGRDLETLTGALLPIEPGMSVALVGSVDVYRDAPQIVPASTREIVLLPEPVAAAPERAIGTLRATDVGRLVAVRGTVTGVTPFSAGLRIAIDDGTGAVTTVVWNDLAQALPAVPTPGDAVAIVGQVSLYQQRVELVLQRAIDVRILDL